MARQTQEQPQEKYSQQNISVSLDYIENLLDNMQSTVFTILFVKVCLTLHGITGQYFDIGLTIEGIANQRAVRRLSMFVGEGFKPPFLDIPLYFQRLLYIYLTLSYIPQSIVLPIVRTNGNT